jgi:hypothetical protein
MSTHRAGGGLQRILLAAGLAALAASLVQPVRAEVRVTGAADSVLIEANEATVEEALAALQASFNLRYRTGTALKRAVTGTYAGSLPRVIARLLSGYDYAIQSSAEGIGAYGQKIKTARKSGSYPIPA